MLARRPGSVPHRRRTADDFDLVGRQWIDRHEMVFAEIGGAASVGAVLDDADAIDVEAPDDRPARGTGREAGAGDAGLGKQEIAELGGALAADFLVGHDGHGRELIRHDRQHALLGRGGDRCGLRLCRRLPVLAGRGAGYSRGCTRRHYRLTPHDRAWRRHGDFRQLCRGRWRCCVLRHRAVGHRA
jgi:hypothetical protein